MSWGVAFLALCALLTYFNRHTLRTYLRVLVGKALTVLLRMVIEVLSSSPSVDAASEAEFESIASVYTRGLQQRGVHANERRRSMLNVWRACIIWREDKQPHHCAPIRAEIADYMRMVDAYTCDIDMLFIQRTLLGARMHDHLFEELLNPATEFPEICESEGEDPTEKLCQRQFIDNCFALFAVTFAHSSIDTLRTEGTLEEYIAPEYPELMHKPHFHPKIITLACKLLLMPPEKRPHPGPVASDWYLSLLHAPNACSCQSEVFNGADTLEMTLAALNDSNCIRSLLRLLQQQEDERSAALAALTLRTLVLHARTHARCRPLLSHLVQMGVAKPIATALVKRCKEQRQSERGSAPRAGSSNTRGQKVRVRMPPPCRPEREKAEREPPFVYHRLQCCGKEEKQLVTVAALCATLRAAALHDPNASWPDGLLAAYLSALVELNEEDNGGVLQLALTAPPGSTEGGTLCACDLPLYMRTPQYHRALQANLLLIKRHGVMTGLLSYISHPVNEADDELPDAAVPASADFMQFYLDMLKADPVEGMGLLVNTPPDQLLGRLHAVMTTLLKIVIETRPTPAQGGLSALSPYYRALSAGARLLLFLLDSPAALPLKILHPGNLLTLDSPALRASLTALAEKQNVVSALRVAGCLQPGSVMWDPSCPPEFGPRVPASMAESMAYGPTASMPPTSTPPTTSMPSRGSRAARCSGRGAAGSTRPPQAPPSASTHAPGPTHAPPSARAHAPGPTHAPPSASTRATDQTHAPSGSSARARGAASGVGGCGRGPVSNGAPAASADSSKDHLDPGLRALAHAWEVDDVLKTIQASCGGGGPVGGGPQPARAESETEVQLRRARDRAMLDALVAGAPPGTDLSAGARAGAHSGARQGSSSTTTNSNDKNSSSSNNNSSCSRAAATSPPGAVRPGFLQKKGHSAQAGASEVNRSSNATQPYSSSTATSVSVSAPPQGNGAERNVTSVAQAGPSSTDHSCATSSTQRSRTEESKREESKQGVGAEGNRKESWQGSGAEGNGPWGAAGVQPNNTARGAKAPQRRQAPKTCAACGKVDRGLKACGRCERVHFCGQECQRAVWPSHRLVCAPKDKGT